MQDEVRKNETDPESLKASFTYKLPAYILGILFGFLVMQVAMAWFSG